VIQIKLPPLRERIDDIPRLVMHFLKKFSSELNKTISTVSPEAHRLLQDYAYPGNVRELQNIIERAVALESSEELTAQNLRSYLDDHLQIKKGGMDLDIPSEGLEKFVEEIERTLLVKALDRTHGIKKKAAELLGINFRSMRYRLEKYGLNQEMDP